MLLVLAYDTGTGNTNSTKEHPKAPTHERENAIVEKMNDNRIMLLLLIDEKITMIC